MLRKLRRLSDFSPGELLVLLQLSIFSMVAIVGLKFLSLPKAIAFLTRCATHPWFRCLPLFYKRYEYARLMRLADLAARIIQREGHCLTRSLLVFWLLRARGEPAQLLIGVSKEAETLNSHAWIEMHGRVIGDHAELTGSFATLLRF